MPPALVSSARLRSLSGLDGAVELFRDLGYVRQAAPIDTAALGMSGLATAKVVRTSGPRRTGYGVLFAESPDPPRSLRPLARRLQREVHDRPLGVIGVPGPSGRWARMIVFRPRRVSGQLGAVTVSRLDIDLAHPTGHDVEVLSELQWRPYVDDGAAQAAVDHALDVEAVTARFYRQLVPHFRAVEAAVEGAAARNVITGAGIETAGGTRRVAIRILTQILFCYFLQRKGLLAGDRDYLSRAFTQRRGAYYPTVLEPLFYEVLAKPAGERPRQLGGVDVPFLNGGLFERRYGDLSLDLPDPAFDLDQGLIGYLDHWTFTAGEERADEQEVAVDPEMLGRVFESLLPEHEREQKGTYYTPRPVVQFMCREALVARLASDSDIGETAMRTLVTEDEPLEHLRRSSDLETVRSILRRLDQRLDELNVLDPAVGSGAFLLGMLGEIVRLRSISHLGIHGRPAGEDQSRAWKLHAIERTLFGIDIEPVAVELCRLRLWLSLVVELEPSRPVPPLPNLEYRTIAANSLVDYVEGAPIQNTRASRDLMLGPQVTAEVIDLRARYFEAADPGEKRRLRGRLLDTETALLSSWLAAAREELAERPAAQTRLQRLEEELRAPDRVYPVFMPEFSAPDVWNEGGWDIVIMNPPYVGRKELAQRYSPPDITAIEAHFGATNDMMILFAERAQQLTREGGVVSMIFNDSIFTSADGNGFRRRLLASTTPTAIARTRCFEGQAINGGVIVARRGSSPDNRIRWIEGFGRPVADFAAASASVGNLDPGEFVTAGEMEVFEAPAESFTSLPHRPLFRPSSTALSLLDRFEAAMPLAITGADRAGAWDALSNTRALEKRIDALARTGFYDDLEPGQFVLLGLVTEGGQGLATADDRRFLAAIDGTSDADEHRRQQARLERATRSSRFAAEYERLLRSRGDREQALLAIWEGHGAERTDPLPWPRTGTFRIANPDRVRRAPLSESERHEGLAGADVWVPFEKGDQSQEVDGLDGRTSRIGSAWVRDNPIVIDWSVEAVQLLRRRAASSGTPQKPYFRNKHLWFHEGVTWNSLASYLRVRITGHAAIFGHMSPLLRPRRHVPWLTPRVLLALLNSNPADYLLRTFLGSRMHIEVGDLRRLPIPVLDDKRRDTLEHLADEAIVAKRAADAGGSREELRSVEAEVDRVVCSLYGVGNDADFWVVR